MSAFVRFVAAVIVVATVAPTAFAQAPAADKKAAAPAAPARPTGPDPVLATVNGEPIRRSEVAGLLSRFSIPAGEETVAYEKAMDLLVNTRILTQFLKGLKIAVPEAEIQQTIDEYDQNLKKNNTSLANALASEGTTPAEFRDRIALDRQWKKFILSRATDAELKKYADQNRDIFNGSMISASHILISVEPDASEADKEKAKQRILSIKKEIDDGKMTFADAANKYSEDEGNKATPAGGSLGFFPRKGKFIESFSAAAFALKRKGEISQPVLTEYGWHLIQLNDRKEGRPVDFSQFRDQILAQYAADLQNKIVTEQKAKAKIDIKPMPAGLIPKEDLAPPETATPKGAAPKPAAPKNDTPKR